MQLPQLSKCWGFNAFWRVAFFLKGQVYGLQGVPRGQGVPRSAFTQLWPVCPTSGEDHAYLRIDTSCPQYFNVFSEQCVGCRSILRKGVQLSKPLSQFFICGTEIFNSCQIIPLLLIHNSRNLKQQARFSIVKIFTTSSALLHVGLYWKKERI